MVVGAAVVVVVVVVVVGFIGVVARYFISRHACNFHDFVVCSPPVRRC